MAEGKRAARSSELVLPLQGAGIDFVRRELSGPVRRRGPPKTFRIDNSSVLSRVREFLPQLAAAEGQLQEMVSSGSPGRVDIEDISDDQPHIALDLALIPLAGDDELTRGGSSSSSSSESDGEEEEEGMVAEFQLKLPGQRKSRIPGIEELHWR